MNVCAQCKKITCECFKSPKWEHPEMTEARAIFHGPATTEMVATMRDECRFLGLLTKGWDNQLKRKEK